MTLRTCLSLRSGFLKGKGKRSVAVCKRAFIATGTHVQAVWITECYLPPSRGDIPVFSRDKADTRFSWVDHVTFERFLTFILKSLKYTIHSECMITYIVTISCRCCRLVIHLAKDNDSLFSYYKQLAFLNLSCFLAVHCPNVTNSDLMNMTVDCSHPLIDCHEICTQVFDVGSRLKTYFRKFSPPLKIWRENLKVTWSFRGPPSFGST